MQVRATSGRASENAVRSSGSAPCSVMAAWFQAMRVSMSGMSSDIHGRPGRRGGGAVLLHGGAESGDFFHERRELHAGEAFENWGQLRDDLGDIAGHLAGGAAAVAAV